MHKILIGEEWRETDQREEIKSPYDGQTVGEICIGSQNDLDDAISAAQKAFKITRQNSSADRSRILSNIAKGIEKNADDLAKTITLEAGKPISQSKREVQRAITTFTIAAEESKRITGEILPIDIDKSTRGYSAKICRFPLGPVAAISPFNFPLNLVAHKVAPAIAAGNTVVHKPAHNTPITAYKLGEIIEKSGAIPGTYNVLQCKRPYSENLATDERLKMLTFTGSAEVGWHLKKLANKKKVALELGGNAGVVVDEECDLKWAAQRCAMGAFAYAGQICISIQRIFVHKSVYDSFLELFLKETSSLKVGDPMVEDTFVGPIIDEENTERIMKWIDEARSEGAKLLAGGERKNNIITPAVLTGVRPKQKISCEEVFGPVVTVDPCDNFFDGVGKVDDSKYGLQAGIFTYDIRKIETAYRDIEVGGLIVNDFPTFRVDNYPYGGVKESGFGREGLKYAIEEMTELKTMVVNGNK